MDSSRPTSVRTIVREIQDEVLKSEDLMPDRAAELLVRLSSVFGNILDEIRKRESEYKQVLLLALDSEKSANRATIRAQTDPSYNLFIEAKHTKDLCEELTRSLKYFLKNKETEMRYS